MAIVTADDISKGRTALDVVASRNKRNHPRFLCIPIENGRTKHVFKMDLEERLYDLGLVENWRTIFRLARSPLKHRRWRQTLLE